MARHLENNPEPTTVVEPVNSHYRKVRLTELVQSGQSQSTHPTPNKGAPSNRYDCGPTSGPQHPILYLAAISSLPGRAAFRMHAARKLAAGAKRSISTCVVGAKCLQQQIGL
jgi:hypothetical protein